MEEDLSILTAKELQLEHSGRLGPVYVHGYTMAPFLQEGDLVTSEPVRWQELEPGDVVIYRDALKFPARRVIEVQDGIRHVVLKSDRQPPRRFFVVPTSEVLGRVVARQRDGEWLRAEDAAWQEVTRSTLGAARALIAERQRPNRKHGGEQEAPNPPGLRATLRAYARALRARVR